MARSAARGVSLIEALVALAVMAFGMLAVAGLQATMRLNADIAKQRSEAVRIGQEAIEDWRGFTAMVATAGVVDYTDVATVAGTAVAGYTTNTTYTLTRTVTDDTAGLRSKALRVDVDWTDRTGAQQGIQLNSMIAAVAPEVAAALAVPSPGAPNKLPRGRHPSVPIQARDFGDGTSGFKPPQYGGGTVAWRFNNLSGLVTSVCTVPAETTNAGLTVDNLSSGCTSLSGQVLSGYVRFATSTVTAPTAAVAENPASSELNPARSALNLDIALTLTSTGHPSPPSACFDDAPTSSTAAGTQTAVAYYCLIYANTARTWSGISTITPAAFTDVMGSIWVIDGTGATNYKACRYTPSSSCDPVVNGGATDAGRLWGFPGSALICAAPSPQTTPPTPSRAMSNADHPRNYSAVTQALTNQNFLVISAQWSCPTDVSANPAAGNFVNSNTRQHQPTPSP